MSVRSITAAADGHHNEDLVAVFEQPGLTDILVMDGATSVAGQAYIDSASGDPAWFVHTFAASIAGIIGEDASQPALVRRAIDATRAAFLGLSGGSVPPLYAWPIAALTWVRIEHTAGGARLHLYCLGDCTTVLRLADGAVTDLDPYVNPQEGVLQQAIAQLVAQGVADPAARKARLLPMLRARREQQQLAVQPEILCLDPQGRFAARTGIVDVPEGAMLLVMTDGFYRIVDSYGMRTLEELAEDCLHLGPAAMLAQLRAHEASQPAAGGLAIKRADDASAVTWRRA